VLITAGPTHEPIDAVRYIGNRSSGQMGLALAKATVERGWSTALLLGPTALSPAEHSLLTTFRFRTTADLAELLQRHWPQHDLLFMAAAVADFRPIASATESKLNRSAGPVSLSLEPTPDLLASLSQSTRPDQVRIGFALESADKLEASARSKLLSKHLDAIVANPLETMDSPQISGTLLLADGTALVAPQSMPKAAFAQWLVQNIEPIWDARLSSPRHRQT
jgi:phosphopantothenoylcysteine decarboxylase/phosphopantothenate--cysteine ligase